jgi:hypothetical protein
MPKFQLSRLYPDGLSQIFDIFSRKFHNFSEDSQANSKTYKNLVCSVMCQPTKHFHAIFQLSSFYRFHPDGLQNFNLFSGFKKNLRISKF